MVDRAFEALQNGMKISMKKPRPGILRLEDTGRNSGFERYLVYFDFKNYNMYENLCHILDQHKNRVDQYRYQVFILTLIFGPIPEGHPRQNFRRKSIFEVKT
jgi:hypothetical protein